MNGVQLLASNLRYTGLDGRWRIEGLSPSTIEMLNLGSNRLGSGTDNLPCAFREWDLPELNILHLDSSTLGRESCEAVSLILQKENAPLKLLSLYNNDLDDEWFLIMAGALRNNTSWNCGNPSSFCLLDFCSPGTMYNRAVAPMAALCIQPLNGNVVSANVAPIFHQSL